MLVSLGVIIPPPHVMSMARDLLVDHDIEVEGEVEVEGQVDIEDVNEGKEYSSEYRAVIPSKAPTASSAPPSTHKENMSRKCAHDVAHVVVGSAEYERILSVFAEAALHASVNNRRHCSKDNKYAELLTLLTYCESELCLDPTGNQGSIWTDGDILHYWKYCVHASLKAVDKDKVKERSLKEEDADDDDNEEFLNKFYTPILSSEITTRWSKIGLDLQEKDFMEVRVVRQKRFLEKERLESMQSDSDVDIDASQGTNEHGHDMDNSGDETEGTGAGAGTGNARDDRSKIRRDRRAYSVLGFTAMGVAGCVSAAPLDPAIRPRARALKNKNRDKDKDKDKDKGDEKARGEDGEGDDDIRQSNPESQTIELRDDWISVPGIGHHTMRGDTFESLQQEEWSNVQVCFLLYILIFLFLCFDIFLDTVYPLLNSILFLFLFLLFVFVSFSSHFNFVTLTLHNFITIYHILSYPILSYQSKNTSITPSIIALSTTTLLVIKPIKYVNMQILTLNFLLSRLISFYFIPFFRVLRFLNFFYESIS